MEFKQLVDERRSVRDYASAASREDIEAILALAQKAPSWKNDQPARSYVVVSPEKLAEVREKGLPSFNQNSSAGASLIVTTFVRNLSGFGPEGPANKAGNYWGAYDLGLRDAFLVLAAADLGFDTLIMGIRDAEALREILDIPEEEEILSVIAVGKRASEPGIRPRMEVAEVAKFF